MFRSQEPAIGRQRTTQTQNPKLFLDNGILQARKSRQAAPPWGSRVAREVLVARVEFKVLEYKIKRTAESCFSFNISHVGIAGALFQGLRLMVTSS